jgi:hypothetical protein
LLKSNFKVDFDIDHQFTSLIVFILFSRFNEYSYNSSQVYQAETREAKTDQTEVHQTIFGVIHFSCKYFITHT